MWDKIATILTANWSFLAVALILGLIGEVSRSVVVGDDEEAAKKIFWKSIFIRTQPLHLLTIGGLLGLVLGALVPTFVAGGVTGSVLYFALAGALSTGVYHIAETAAPEIVIWVRGKLNGAVAKKATTPAKPPVDDGNEPQQ